VSVGDVADTAEFAVESIRRWWNQMGRRRFPEATTLMITADAGGSNGPRVRAWKYHLARLARERERESSPPMGVHRARSLRGVLAGSLLLGGALTTSVVVGASPASAAEVVQTISVGSAPYGISLDGTLVVVGWLGQAGSVPVEAAAHGLACGEHHVGPAVVGSRAGVGPHPAAELGVRECPRLSSSRPWRR